MGFAGGPALWMQVGTTHAEAFRSPEMGEAFAHDLRDNWFALGGDLYVHWGFAGGYDRLIEDVRRPDGPRYQAMRALEITMAPEGVAIIRGRDFTPNEIAWDAARPEWTDALPIALDGVMVRIAGRDCAVRRAGPNLVDALLPDDLERGAHEVEVHTNRGAARATIRLEPGMVHSSECRR